ncbi:PTS sugar transporter subunit IIA [Chlamydiales bacterium]|nr:PTS sugar transporter subunit IIA [Chlamydiales bacterium]
MDLKMGDVSKMLKVSETTIRRWLSEGKIPSYKLGNQYRFSPMEIEEWVIKRKIGQNSSHPIKTHEEEEIPAQGSNQYSLYRAIHKGTVFSNIQGDTKEEVIKQAMGPLSEQMNLDPELMTELLLNRERMMPTALNKGIAVPHTREILLQRRQDIVGVAFLENPIAYGALDGKPVNTLFFLFASGDKRHLHLLAKIAHLASLPKARELFKARPNKMRLLDFIKDWEANLKEMV